MERQEILEMLQQKINQIKNNDNVISEDDFCDSRGIGLNSLELLTVIVYIEERFNFELDDEDLLLDNFECIANMVDTIIAYLGKEGN